MSLHSAELPFKKIWKQLLITLVSSSIHTYLHFTFDFMTLNQSFNINYFEQKENRERSSEVVSGHPESILKLSWGHPEVILRSCPWQRPPSCHPCCHPCPEGWEGWPSLTCLAWHMIKLYLPSTSPLVLRILDVSAWVWQMWNFFLFLTASLTQSCKTRNAL